jgi:hypothetical protein
MLACATAAVAMWLWAVLYERMYPEAVEANRSLVYERCDPKARHIDRWGQPSCDFIAARKAKGTWPLI